MDDSHGAAQQQRTADNINSALGYLDKVKARFNDEPDTYKQFLDILTLYYKDREHVQEVSFLIQPQREYR
jgi:paired amphipathic helix protein Sin3a